MPVEDVENVLNGRERREFVLSETNAKLLIECRHQNQLAKRIPGRNVAPSRAAEDVRPRLFEHLRDPTQSLGHRHHPSRVIGRYSHTATFPARQISWLAHDLLCRIATIYHQVDSSDPCCRGSQQEHRRTCHVGRSSRAQWMPLFNRHDLLM